MTGKIFKKKKKILALVVWVIFLLPAVGHSDPGGHCVSLLMTVILALTSLDRLIKNKVKTLMKLTSLWLTKFPQCAKEAKCGSSLPNFH